MTNGKIHPPVWVAGRGLRVLVVTGLMLVVLLVACGGGANAGIPTAGESQGTAPAAANPTPTPVDEQDAALVYAQCIRANGFPEWPDPDAEGRIVMRRDQGINFNDPRRLAAMEACQDLRPPGLAQGGLGAGGGAQGLDKEAVFEFARCMRENGVPDFPDPGPGGGIRIVGGPGTGMDPNAPKFQAAMQTCRASLQGAAR